MVICILFNAQGHLRRLNYENLSIVIKKQTKLEWKT